MPKIEACVEVGGRVVIREESFDKASSVALTGLDRATHYSAKFNEDCSGIIISVKVGNSTIPKPSFIRKIEPDPRTVDPRPITTIYPFSPPFIKDFGDVTYVFSMISDPD